MLSKSKILKGKKCHKALWLSKFKREEVVISESQQSIFQTGTDVGELAQQYFPNGVLAQEEDFPNKLTANRTEYLIQKGITTIYEATFIYNNVLVAVDILTKTDNGWTIYEVKSTNSCKPEHIQDIAIQYYVLKNLGYDIIDARVMHFDNTYKRQGNIDVQKLFTSESVLELLQDYQDEISARIPELITVLKGDEPEIKMGDHCNKPYGCEFNNYCSGLVINKIEEAIADDLDPDAVTVFKQTEIKNFLNEVQYPLYSFDFETVMYAVPEFNQSSPYQQIPFQYSLIYQASADSEPIYYDYIGNGVDDPREELIKSMIRHFEHDYPTLTYNATFERTCIKNLAIDFPKYEKELMRIHSLIVDIMPVYKTYYKTNKTAHSGSLKVNLPAYIEGMSYDHLEISQGMETMQQYADLHQIESPELKSKVIENMLIYCRQDTLGVVKLYDYILEKMKW
jgi:Domain of unknown function(DUF2779)/Domain of unknown function DUF83